MATIKTTRTYALADFVSSTQADVNAKIFAQELQDDENVSEKPTSVVRSGTAVIVTWSNVVVSQDTLNAVDAAVAAHVGGVYTLAPLTAISEAESSDDSGEEQTKLTLSTGLLPAGKYFIGWYCEAKTAAQVDNSGVTTRLYVSKSGNAEVLRGESTWPYPQYTSFSGTFPVNVVDGESYTLRLAYERLGASNEVSVQRARMYVISI